MRFFTSLPSAFMEKISLSPSSTRTKTIRVPSGDQAGSRSSSGQSVSWTTSVPSAFMEKISKLPVRSLVKTSRPLIPGKAACTGGDPHRGRTAASTNAAASTAV